MGPLPEVKEWQSWDVSRPALTPEEIDDEAFCDDQEEPTCEHCGKPLYDFSDIGCGECDRRSPDYGLS